MELKKNGQAERDQLKKELTTCRELQKHRYRLDACYATLTTPRDCHGIQKRTH